MDTSILLAKIIGPMLIVIGAGVFINLELYRRMVAGFAGNTLLIYMAGTIALLLGLIVVTFHNVWEWRWPVIITILGWVSVIAGVFRVVFPDSVKSLGEDMIRTTGAFTAGGIIQGVIGAWLCYVSYMA